MRRYIAIILFWLVWPYACHAQDQQNLPPLQYRIEVRLLQVEVFVYDKNKEFVPGLKKEDFILYEDGKKQEIRSADEINITTTQQKITAIESDAANRRIMPLNSIILIFDKGHISHSSAQRINDSVKDFISKNVNDKNIMAIFALDNFGSYQIIKDFSNSSQELINALESQTIGTSAIDSRGAKIQSVRTSLTMCKINNDYNRVCGNVCDESLLSKAVTEARPYSLDEQQNALHITQSLTTIFRFLQHAPGQKSILFFSEGFDPIGNYYYAFLSDSIQQCPNLNSLYPIIAVLKDDSKINAMDNLIQSANASRLTFYWLNPQNADLLFRSDSNVKPKVAMGNAFEEVFNQLKKLSDDTGGFSTQNSSLFEDYFNNLNKNLSHYYVISYSPKRHAQDSKVHKIKVEAGRSSIKVIARKSFTDFSSKDEIDIMLASALDFPELCHQIDATIDFAYFMDDKNKITSTVSIAMPLSSLTSIRTGDNFMDEVHFAYLIKNEKGDIVTKDHKMANVNLPLSKFNDLLKNNSIFQNLHSFQLKPGVYTLYAAILDAGGWKLTGWKTPLHIALKEKDCFSLSPLIVASSVEHTEQSPGNQANHSVFMQSDGTIKYKDKRITFSAIRNLPPSGQLVGLYQIFNANYTPQSKASLQISFKLYDETNNLISSLPPKEINDFTDFPNKLITNFFILPYKNLSANNYRLVLEAKDSLAHCKAESSAHFTIKQ